MAVNADASTPQVHWYEQIETGYQHLADKSDVLHSAATRYCKQPGAGARSDLNASWATAFAAWQAVRFVDFGPVEQDNRAWQFQFWPDSKNLVGRKAGQLLSAEASTLEQRVADGGVAVQGFPMAEFLLFDQQLNESGSALPGAPSCALLQAVAGHIQSNAQSLRDEWKAFRPHYLDGDQYRITTFKAAMTALDILVERRLAAPMGLRGNDKRSVYQADAWRSGHSLTAIKGTVDGLQNYFLPGLSFWLNDSGEPALAEQIDQQVAKIMARLDELPGAMGPLLADEEFSRLQGLYVDLSQLQQLVNDQAASALGVVKGFNSSDGD